MSRMFGARATLRLLGGGHVRARLRASREGQTAIRLQVVTAALKGGVLDALAAGDATIPELMQRTAATDPSLFPAFLRVMAASGLVMSDGDGRWRLTAAGRAIVEDDLTRAAYEAFGGFHTGLYRELWPQLSGGPRRRDVVEQGAVIARLSAAFDPFVHAALARAVGERAPHRVLDVGCGAGLQLATMLETAPRAEGIGVEADEGAAELAERTLRARGLSGRATVVRADVRGLLTGARGGPLGEPFDFALLANVVHYVPVVERVELLRSLAGLLGPAGVLMIVTTAATPQLFSRHLDLLFRAQEGAMELPDADALVDQLAEAGLRPQPPQRIAPGNPLIAVCAVAP